MTKCTCHGADEAHRQTIVSVLERPRYSPGLILEDSDLTAAVVYTQQLSRLLFSNLFGCGVICGLNVDAKHDCDHEVTVNPGLALDGCGDPIQVVRPVKIKLDPVKAVRDTKPQPFWVLLCGGEKLCAPRTLVCDADDFDGVTQPTRARATATVMISFDKQICACALAKTLDERVPNPVLANPVGQKDTKPVGDECAVDCGCGTACACGCCVVLAKVTGEPNATTGKIDWKVWHHGVRRFVRPKMMDDPRVPSPKTDPAGAAPEPEILIRDARDRLELALNAHPYNTIGKKQVMEMVRRTMEGEQPVAAEPAVQDPQSGGTS